MSTTNIVVDRAKKNVRTLFPPFLILLFVDSPHQSGCLLVRVCPWRLVVPLRQRGGQPIPLRRPHLWQLPQRLHLLQRLRRRTSGLRQRLRHYLLSPQLPKWIPLPLYQPARPQMVLRPLLVLPVVSPVVWCLLSMLRIFAASTIVRCVP